MNTGHVSSDHQTHSGQSLSQVSNQSSKSHTGLSIRQSGGLPCSSTTQPIQANCSVIGPSQVGHSSRTPNNGASNSSGLGPGLERPAGGNRKSSACPGSISNTGVGTGGGGASAHRGGSRGSGRRAHQHSHPHTASGQLHSTSFQPDNSLEVDGRSKHGASSQVGSFSHYFM
ncbi:unnamed protein product [Protopolystoma xenopodis]|uniref:Uncharacterized protein n=1 Tax=Protopolystoma xenopodis TaxID=117903 RepID=A0A3S5CRL9_9PLAT|nr:unnamed protein product [Protopolystoma xenopodis]